MRTRDVNEKRLGSVLALAHERDLREFAACVAGKKDPDFNLDHDLAVQEALLKASNMT